MVDHLLFGMKFTKDEKKMPYYLLCLYTIYLSQKLIVGHSRLKQFIKPLCILVKFRSNNGSLFW